MPKIRYYPNFGVWKNPKEIILNRELIAGKENCDILLPNLPTIDKKHLKFSFSVETNEFLATCLSDNPTFIELNSDEIQLKKNQTISLGKRAVFIIGEIERDRNGTMIFYENTDYVEKKEEENQVVLSKSILNSNNTKTETFRAQVDILLEDYFSHLPYNRTQYTIARYTRNFLKKYFTALSLVVVYKRGGDKKFRSVADNFKDIEDSREKEKAISKKCFAEMLHVKCALQFSITTQTEDDYRTLAQNNVRTTFLFPLKVGNEIFGAIYMDSAKGLDESDYQKILKILDSGVSDLLSAYLLNPNENEINEFERYKENIEHAFEIGYFAAPGWKIYHKRKVGRTITEIRSIKDGVCRTLFGSLTENTLPNIMLACYIKGLLDRNFAKEGNYLKYVKEFSLSMFPKTSLNFAEIILRFPFLGDVSASEISHAIPFKMEVSGIGVIYCCVKEADKIEDIALNSEVLIDKELETGDFIFVAEKAPQSDILQTLKLGNVKQKLEMLDCGICLLAIRG